MDSMAIIHDERNWHEDGDHKINQEVQNNGCMLAGQRSSENSRKVILFGMGSKNLEKFVHYANDINHKCRYSEEDFLTTSTSNTSCNPSPPSRTSRHQ